MQDGAPAHTAASNRNIQLQGLQVLQLPAKSCDLNIIEHLWSLLKRRLVGKKHSRAELQKDVVKNWNALIDSGVVQSLCNSMPSRCAAVIQARGDVTSY